MKKNFWILGIYPVVCVVLLLVGFNLYKDWITLSFTGEKAEASIDAVFLDKGDGTAELLNRIELEMELTREDGSVVQVEAVDFSIVSIDDDGVSLDLSNGLAGAFDGDQSLATDLEELVRDAADRTEWFMLRQSRLTESTRFVRVEKRETAYIVGGLSGSLDAFTVDDSGLVQPDLPELPEVSEVYAEAVFSYEDQEALKERKGKHLLSYTRTIDGEEVDAGSSELFIHNEPYATIQYPVFVYEIGGGRLAGLSDLGKHGDPFLAFPYRAEAVAVYDADAPGNAMLVGKVTPPEPGEKFLNWFSRVSEIYMTRWVYPFIFGLLAFVCAFVGIMFISMITHPVVNLPPVPEDDKDESEDEDSEETAKA